MSDTPYVIDANKDSFHAQVIERSFQAPVLVDFWAGWCNPCKMLAPILTNLANEYAGKVYVVKVDTDVERELAEQFAVRSLPTVKVFKQGEIVDEFMGVVPESNIRELIEKYMTRESDLVYNEARAALNEGDLTTAKTKMQQAYDLDPDRKSIILGMAEVHLESGSPETAAEYLHKIPLAHETDDDVQNMHARLMFASGAKTDIDVDELVQRIEQNPKDCEALHQLGAYYVLQKDYETALDTFLKLLLVDKGFKEGLARKAMLAIFTMLGGSGPLVTTYRSRMANALL